MDADDIVKGTMLFKNVGDGVLSLEYCYTATNDPYTLAAMLECVEEYLASIQPDTQVRMILANDQSQKLYSKLFGKISEEMLIYKGIIPCDSLV